MPVWSMTLTAILTPGSGSSNGMVLVVNICSHFSGSISRLKAALRFLCNPGVARVLPLAHGSADVVDQFQRCPDSAPNCPGSIMRPLVFLDPATGGMFWDTRLPSSTLLMALAL